MALIVVVASGCDRVRTVDESLALARQRRDQGNPQGALIELKNALQKDAGNRDARFMLVELYLALGQGIQAEIELRRLADMGMDERRLRVPSGRALLLQGNYNRIIAETRGGPAFDAVQNSQIAEIRGQAFLGLGQLDNASRELKQALVDQPDFADALVGEAQVALLKLDPVTALRLIDRVLVSDPDHARSLLLKGDILRYTGKPDEAMAAYERVLVKAPSNALALSDVAYLQIAGGHYDEAAKQIAKIRAFGNGVATANYLQALLDYRRHDMTAARDSIQKALAVAPAHLPSIMLAGSVEYALGAYEQAERLMRQVMAASPTTIYSRQVLAMTLIKLGRPAEAADVLAPALQMSQDSRLLALAGEAYSQARQYGKATELFGRAMAAEPDNLDNQLRLGMNRLANGSSDLAIKDFETAIDLRPGVMAADFALIMTRMRRGELDLALDAARQFEQRQPNSPIAMNLHGGVLLAKRDPDGARALFRKALAADPAYLPAAMNLARMDLEDKKPDAARQELELLLTKAPNDVEALVAYSNLLRELRAPLGEIVAPLEKARAADGKAVEPRLLLVQNLAASDPKRAMSPAKEALALAPLNPSVLDAAGLVQAAVGETGAALATYAKLVEVDPKSGTAHARLAELYAATGNDVAAIRELRTVLALDPKDRDAQLRLLAFEGRSGRTGEALKLAQQIQSESPKLVIGYILEGDVWIAAKKPQQALVAYERAYQINPSKALLLKIHAALVAGGRVQEANTRLTRWLTDHSDDIETRIYYANYLLRAAQFRPAAEQYQRVVEADPKNVIALNDLAWLQGKLGDPKSGVELAGRAYALQPDNPRVADTYGTLLLDAGRTQQGADVLKKAADATPNFFDMRMRLARAYLKLGDEVKARQQFDSVANLSADAQVRNEALKALAAIEH